jgi:hypothetical protein
MPHRSIVGDVSECTSIISSVLKVNTLSYLLIDTHTHTHYLLI